MARINDAWADVESYLAQSKFEDAGVAIGMIVNELDLNPDMDALEELIQGIYGEINV